MRKICSVFMAFLMLMGVFAIGAVAAETPPMNMEERVFIQRGITADRSINLRYFEKLDSDDVFWTVENDRLFTIDNDGKITFYKFASFFGGTTIVKALDEDGNVLGQTKVIVTWKWYYYLISTIPAFTRPGRWIWWLF